MPMMNNASIAVPPIIPPADLFLPYVDQQILNQLANRDIAVSTTGTSGRQGPNQNSGPVHPLNGSDVRRSPVNLTQQACHYINLSIAPGTRRTYHAGQTRYLLFCRMYGMNPYPLTQRLTILFMTHLATSSLTYGTLKVYLAAIIRAHIEAGFTSSIRDDLLLHFTMQGIKRHHGVPNRVKLPITIALMRMLKNTVANHPTICDHDKAMLWSAFTLAFFGFLRVSEFIAPTSMTFDPQRTLLTADITCNTDLIIALKASKTDPFRRGCNIIIAPSQSSVCAVQAYQAYKALHSSVAHLPAFQFANSNFLTRQAVSNHIRDLLTRASVPDVNHYTTHSFRSGAATTAADANLPDWLIKALGRWRSDAYQTYIRTPPSIIRSVPGHLSLALP
uniref:Uncharacterized protein LOC102807347 n=1 Tax=Saccoglossus kowalevskii TaxID=10224 RepID=A0ABM0M1R5_SACKO|nr:PREDICTED: uncharacterized protein LOC102807347 [Saccoglossus kowalevskii]